METERNKCFQISTNPEVNELLKRYFKSCELAKTIWAIAQAESSGNQLAVNKGNRNKSIDCGWLQVNSIHRDSHETKAQFCGRMKNLEENVKEASEVYAKQGLTAWVTYNTKAYLAYLK